MLNNSHQEVIVADVEYEEVGYMKFSGKAVPAGVIDAGSAGKALVGLDEAIRFFNARQSPDFARLEYQLPVRTTEGSWVAWLLGSVGAGAGIFAASYLKKAAEKMAENDFKDVGLRDVLKKSIDALQSFIKLVKHTRLSKEWDTQGARWRKDNSEIGVLNARGEALFINADYLRWYASLPPRLISKIIGSVAEGRDLIIGVKVGDGYDEVSVKPEDKALFIEDEKEVPEDDYLFPDLQHGDEVRLEGRLIRGNASSNSLGLEYKGHILNCFPEQGSIKRFKPALFLRCIVEGAVSRMGKQRMVSEKRPTIIIRNVIPLEHDRSYDLFDSSE